jgi:hypothetical protein
MQLPLIKKLRRSIFMPRITNQNLTLTTNGANVTVNVTYDATFNRFERNLANLGLIFRESVMMVGIDPPGTTTGTDLFTLGIGTIPVTAGNTDLTLPRGFTRVVARSFLNEDPGTILPDNDEIRGRIRISAETFPTQAVELFTEQDILTDQGGVG